MSMVSMSRCWLFERLIRILELDTCVVIVGLEVAFLENLLLVVDLDRDPSEC